MQHGWHVPVSDDTLEFEIGNRNINPRPLRSARPNYGRIDHRRRPPRPSRPVRPGRRPYPPPVRLRPRYWAEPAPPCVCPAHRTEFVRWVQLTLNTHMGTRLPVDGVMSAATRHVLRRFQARQGLPVDGIAGPATEQALMALKGPQREFELPGYLLGAGQGYPMREPEEEFDFSDFPESVLKPLRAGKAKEAVRVAVNLGKRGENLLSDLIFFQRHPARAGRLIARSEPDFAKLSQEWLTIRDTIVRPLVAAAFFAGYELRFNPGSCSFCIDANPDMTAAEKLERKQDVSAIINPLVARRDARAAAALKRRLPVLPRIARDPKSDSLFSRIQRLSTAQLALFKEFFPDTSGGINFDAFQFAFELFTNGELRNPAVGSGFGEPDGGFYFLFAEFAFTCIALDFEKPLWTKALKSMVKTQEIFMHIYRKAPHPAPPTVGTGLPKPGPALRSLNAFRFSNYSGGAGRSDASRKAALRAKYDRLKLNGLKRAARDNLLRAQRMP